MIRTKIKVTTQNLPNLEQGEKLIAYDVIRAADSMVRGARAKFLTDTRNELKWHPWRGGFGSVSGNYIPSMARRAESKASGYLSTGVMFPSVVTGKSIYWGFGDRGRINRLRTRDGLCNLANLIERGAKAHSMPIPTRGFGKSFRAAKTSPTQWIRWSRPHGHPGFKGKMFYTRISAYLQTQALTKIEAQMPVKAPEYLLRGGGKQGLLSRVAGNLFK